MLTLPRPTGEQQEVLYLPPEGHTVVIGSAGCGKTTMALYRALHLGSSQLIAGGDAAVITYNKSLSNWMTAVLDGQDTSPKVLTFHGWAKRILEEAGIEMDAYLSDPDNMDSLTNLAYLQTKRKRQTSRTFQRPPRFFSEEIGWIDGMGLETLAEYLDVNRTGRGETRLDATAREDVWAVRETYRSIRDERGFAFDLRDIASVVLSLPDAASASPFHHVVVDEGQDLSPQMLRAISEATSDEGSITYFGDPTQQIYGKQMSWKSAGFNIRKQWRFERNHRNTREIARLAATIGSEASEATVGKIPRNSGEKPGLIKYATSEDEISKTAAGAADAVEPDRLVAVLSRTHGLSDAIAFGARKADVPTRHLSRSTLAFDPGYVYFGTVHAAKGLEFDDVFVTGLDAGSWPDPSAIDRSDLDAATDQDRKLLYVAVTRARSRLTLSYVGRPTVLLPTDPELYQ